MAYKFHPETWNDAQSQKLCDQWYKEASFDRQSMKNPATNRKIQRGKARWNNIHRYCNKTVRKRFSDLFQFEIDNPTPIVLPDTTKVQEEIREIVQLWNDTSNPFLDKINGYCTDDCNIIECKQHSDCPQGCGGGCNPNTDKCDNLKNIANLCPALFVSKESNESILCIEEKNEEAEEKDTKKQLNGIATDFITLYFFGTVETRLQFINLVVTTFDFFLSELKEQDEQFFSQKNITLMLKGGVTLRLILRDLLKNFSGDLEQIIVYKLRKYIKISDYDFEIVSRKDLFDMDTNTISKFNLLTYLVVLTIRNYLLQHKLTFFNFFRLNTSEQQKKARGLKKQLQKALDNIPTNSTTIEHLQYGGECDDPSSGKFDTDLTPREMGNLGNFLPQRGDATSTCRTDFALVVNPAVYTGETSACFITAKNLLKAYNIKNDTILTLPLQSRDQGSRFYATHNPLIYAEQGSNVIMFNLNRIKYDFTLYCRKNGKLFRESVSGEILDLSHAGSDDRRKKPGDVFPSDHIQLYNFFGYNLDFKSYSLQGFFDDLSPILFSETEWEPWTEVKYKKRIYRLIYVCVLHFFSVYVEGDLTFLERLQYVDGFIEALQMNESPKFRCHHCSQGNLLEKFGEKMEQVMVKAEENGTTESDFYRDFMKTTILILSQVRDALQAEYQLSRDPRFFVGSLYSSDLAIEFPSAYG